MNLRRKWNAVEVEVEVEFEAEVEVQVSFVRARTMQVRRCRRLPGILGTAQSPQLMPLYLKEM
jgi:hypothetical protein